MSVGWSYDLWKKHKRQLEKQDEIIRKRASGEMAPAVSPSEFMKNATTRDRKNAEGLGAKGTLSDGYQAWDISKGILGTTGDIVLSFAEGVGGLAEGLYDLGAHGVALGADLIGQDDFAERVKKHAKENLVADAYEDAREGLGIEDSSFLGDFSRNVTSGLGQVATIIATGGLAGSGAAATALTTGLTGLSSMGSGISEALNNGATDGEAWSYGTMKGAIDAGTELIFGGLGKATKALGISKGLFSADDVLAKKLSSKISNKFFSNLTEWGVKASAEGVEEMLAGFGSAAAKKLTYMSEEELGQLIKDENLLEQFATGVIVSGIAQSGDFVKSTKQGKDFVTDLTTNEEAVVEAEYKNRVAEEEVDGKKLTNKQKNEIYDQVVDELKKGYISTDTIESVLGGDTYRSYQDTVKNEDAILKEFEELGKKQNPTLAEQSRYAELQEKVKEIQSNSQRDKLKSQLSQEVYNSLTRKVGKSGKNVQSDNYLIESYNESARRGQAFEADLSQYDEKTATVVKKAIDSKILNNTRKTHEFVDLVAKISADKGISFDFTNNENLKNSIFAVDGATVNGYVNADGITLNVQSAKALNSVVGHEITHVLEGTAFYGELQTAIFEYAKSKRDYDARRKALEDLYKSVKDADIDAELVADLVGDYLFTDPDFVRHLSTKNRNLFEKIYDEIKYLCKVVTAGSKEARKLEKAKKVFEEVYRESGKAKKSGAKYSLSEQKTPSYDDLVSKKPTRIVKVTDGIESGSYSDMKSAVLNKATNEGWFDTPHHNDDTDSLIFLTEKSFSHAYSNLTAEFGEDTIRCMAHIPEIIKEAVLVSVNDPRNATKREKKVYTFFGAIEGKNGVKPVKLTVKEFDFSSPNALPKNIRSYFEKNGIIDSYNSLYDAHALEIIGIEGIKKEPDASGKGNGKYPLAQATSDSTISIADLLNLVKGDAEKYIPKNFNTAEQTEGKFSLSAEGEQPKRSGRYNVYGKDIALETSPVQEDVAPVVKNYLSMEDFVNRDSSVWRNVDYNDEMTQKSIMQETHSKMVNDGSVVKVPEDVINKVGQSYPDLRGLKKKDRLPILKESMNRLKNNIRQFLNGFKNQGFEFEVNGNVLEAKLYNTGINEVLEKITQEKASMLYTSEEIFKNARYLYSTTDYDSDPNVYRWNYFYSPVQIGEETVGVRIAVRDVMQGQDHLPESQIYNWGIKKDASLGGVQPVVSDSSHGASSDASDKIIPQNIAPVKSGAKNFEDVGPTQDNEEIKPRIEKSEGEKAKEARRGARGELHEQKIGEIRSAFEENGLDFDEVLKNAKDLSTFATVDNTPQRVMEKALGYKEGQILADMTVNKVAQNETEGIKWLNSFTDRKNGLLAKLSAQYGIKAGSPESAAAQMYAEGFYVDGNDQIVKYGDEELAKDFSDVKVRENIKGLANDPRIRQIYDETLSQINKSRARNAYPEIPRLDNYFLHFRAMEDTFSRLGLPFNPNDIRAKDLPTDLNGVTADLKPGQPYFSSSKRRVWKRTSHDLLGGLERYLSSAKNQIYHIDDIQTLRALRNYVADTYGQAKGLEDLNSLTEEEAQERIKQVYGSHLSTFAKFLNEEANILAGKTALIDRALEGIIGRRGITFIDTVNKQVGSNMVGFNVSSSLTNFLAGVQAIAKTDKLACVKALAQTASGKIGSLFGKTDSFVENNPTVIRRKGAERFYRTPYQKVADAGYVLMSAVDNVTTEFIVRAKYNEYIKKGMSESQAITEADKWTSRLMGDRSLGQMPQLYNSKMLGLITKFQLEVRNQLDSQFYDTVQEEKASNADIENGLKKNAKTAAKVTATLFELAVLQHLFGKAFEAVAGYNPAFDIISVLATAFGADDDEDSEDTVLDNVEQAFLELLEDLPYTSTLTGGRIPISSALPIEELIKGQDKYGNDRSRLEILGDIAPYYVLPGGYGQLKKTVQGLSMFDDDLLVSGSYTDNGDLRFPVEDTFGNRVQAGIFGQWANENARDYFDNDRSPLKEKQLKELIDADISIKDYWEHQGEGLSDYEGYGSPQEFEFANRYPEKYAIAKSVGGYDAYKTYSSELNGITADKDENGKTVSGSRKEKVIEYINDLDADYGEKIILFKSEYTADDTYNMEIVEYLNSREDLSYEETVAILKELGFIVHSDGTVTW